MARLACCLVLISLCLCLVLEPAIAARKGLSKISPVKSTKHIAPSQAPSQFNVFPPASAPFPITVPSEYDMAKKLCQDTRKPEMCQKLMEGGEKIDPVTEAKLTIELTSSMALRASAYMSKVSTGKDLAPGKKNDIPPVLKANQAMQGMIQAIRSVARKQAS
ncbi:unnamed protein product [Lupinus luteus]|uniref:Pectinesterase inhibitor domain-containing protein n=1 Tax=Lupinus luteus TaxID=3873 RepID=A0AAV1Y3J4_LUPLU